MQKDNPNQSISVQSSAQLKKSNSSTKPLSMHKKGNIKKRISFFNPLRNIMMKIKTPQIN